MFNPRAFENSRPDGVSVLEIVDTEADAEQPRRFVPLQRTGLGGEIVGPLATLRLTQVYRFTSEQCGQVVEAVYRFPLPGDAAVTGVRARFGDVEIRAELRERQKAESEYDDAKREGRQAALLTRESPDVFTMKVAGIQPDQDIGIETSYVQLARAEGKGWSLRIPLTTSPRYVRDDERTTRHAQGQPLALLHDPGHRFSLDLTAYAAEVKSSTHRLQSDKLETCPTDGRMCVRLADGEVMPDRDCVLSWQPVQELERPAFQVTLHDDPGSEHIYFMGLLTPPSRKNTLTIPREVVLLVDHSGSMSGPKWEAADWAVKRFLGELNEKDSFALGLFHDRTNWFSKGKLQRGDKATIARAIEFLEKQKDQGGTELGVALEQALACERTTGEAARHVLIITDAEVSDAGRILRLADQEAKQPQRRRIDVLCIDAAPNAFLASELAERGGGVSKFLTSAPEEEDITTALDEVLADWTQPVVTGLRLEVNRSNIEAAGHALMHEGGRTAIDIGDLPAGRSLWLTGRVSRDNAGELTFKVLTPANREVAVKHIDLGRERQQRPGLKALFGARRLLGLEYLTTARYEGAEFENQLKRLGYDPAKLQADQPELKAKVYAENVHDASAKWLKSLLVREALHYGLACSETAFIAVRSEAGKPVEETVVIANALPGGWSESFVTRGGIAMSGIAMGGTMLCRAAPAANAADDASADSIDSMLMAFPGSAPAPQRSLLARMASPVTKLFSAVRPARRAISPTGPDIGDAIGPCFITLVDDTLAFGKGDVLLFDSKRTVDAGKLGAPIRLHRLQVEFPDGAPDAATLDECIAVLLFIDDVNTPRARVRLTDLVRQGGLRPLNLMRNENQRVCVVITHGASAPASLPMRLRISLHWE